MAGEINLYLDLDSVLDTRVGLIKTHYPERLSVLATSDYRTREEEDVWRYVEISKETYDRLWSQRGHSELTNSFMTGIPYIANEIMENILKARANDPTMGRVSCTINTYPYTLTTDESESLKDVLAVFLGQSTVLRVVHIPTPHLTPPYVKEHWNIVFMYEFLAWFDMQHKALETHPIPTTTFYVPKLRAKADKTLEEFKDEQFVEDPDSLARKLDPWDALRLTLVTFFDLHHLPVRNFSETLR